MKRRDFLQKTGIAVAGGAGALAEADPCDGALADGRLERAEAADQRKRVLITAAASQLARMIATELNSGYQIRLTGPEEMRSEHEFVKSELGDDETTLLAVRGADVIVHVAAPLDSADESEQIDHRTRCTYNLLVAASRQGVRRLVYLSSLRMITACDPRFEVDEDWRPLPTTSSGGLSHYLGEFTCREFARTGDMDVIVLRLGNAAEGESPAAQPVDPLRLDSRDAVQAVSRAVSVLAGRNAVSNRTWSVYHIQSESPDARFSVRRAKKSLRYQPRSGGSEP
jgi:hypothetical protein